MMKQNLIILISTLLLVTLTTFAGYAQASKWKELALSNAAAYQARGVSVSVFKETYAGLEGQQYTVKFTNTSTQKLKIKGSLIAQTYCGKSVSTAIDITIKPGQTMGGNDYLMDSQGLTGTVQSEDCKTEKIYPNPSDKNHYEYDRISGLALSAMSVEPVADENIAADKTTPANNSSNNSSPVNTMPMVNNETVIKINDLANRSVNNSVTQQKKQQQANNYVNAVNNSTNNDVQKSLDLNLEEINATANGNKSQAQNIQQQINLQVQNNNDQLVNSTVNLIGILSSAKGRRRDKWFAEDQNYLNKGRKAYYNGDTKKAIDILGKAAFRNQGDNKAIELICDIYLNGLGVPKDTSMAVIWLDKKIKDEESNPTSENSALELRELKLRYAQLKKEPVNNKLQLASYLYYSGVGIQNGLYEFFSSNFKLIENKSFLFIDYYREAARLGDTAAISALKKVGIIFKPKENYIPNANNAENGSGVNTNSVDFNTVYKSETDEARFFLLNNAKNNNIITLQSGIQYEIIKSGNGSIPLKGQEVTFNYIATLINGTEIDNTYKRNKSVILKIGMGNMLKGMDETLLLMSVGSKWKIYIPSELAYGNQAVGAAPAKSVLIFDTELLNIQ